MAKRNIFAAGNLPESLNPAGENGLATWQPIKFIALILANLAALLETARAEARSPVLSTTGNVHAPATNTAAIVTFAGATGVTHAISGFAYSYAGTTTTGNIKVKDGTNVVLDMDIPAAANGVVIFPRPIKATAGNLLSVTAAAGGSGSTGKVSVLNHFTV